MPNSRRGFLNRASTILMAALAACRKPTQNAAAPAATPGTPPAFGTAPDVGPVVSDATFAEAEKLVQFSLSPSEREQAAGNWRRSMAPLYERRVGPRKFSPPASVAPATRWNPMLPGQQLTTGRDQFVRTSSDPPALPGNDR